LFTYLEKEIKIRGTLSIPSTSMNGPFEYRGLWTPGGDIINNVSNRNIIPVSRLRLIRCKTVIKSVFANLEL